MIALVPWLVAFVFTQVVEAPIYAKLGRLGWRRALLPSALSHPVLWFVIMSPRLELGYTSALVGGELFAWLSEAALLRWGFGVAPTRALLLSALANAASLGLGLLSRAWLGIP